MRDADPWTPEDDPSKHRRIALRDAIMADGSQQHDIKRRARRWAVRAERWTAPVSAVAATAAIVAIAATIIAFPFAPATAPAASPSPAPSSLAYADEFEAARAAATSEFEQEILLDGRITRSEMDAAKSAYVGCIRAAGLTARVINTDDGLWNYEVTGSWNEEFVQTTVVECGIGTIDVIEGLYTGMIQNPQKKDVDELTAECLVARGLVTPPFAGGDYARSALSGQFNRRMMDEADGARCLSDPTFFFDDLP
jgi:hypothetical protein